MGGSWAFTIKFLAMLINKRKKAQSLLEISIFGALLLVFIAALFSYGLRNNYSQQITQQTFRKALTLAKKNRQTTYIYTSDRHIPDPTNPFAQGSFMPTSSMSSITRNYMMNERPESIEALPALAIDIKGSTCPGSGGPQGAPDCLTCADDDDICNNNCQRSPAGSAPPCYFLTSGFRTIQIGTNDACVKRARWEKYSMIYGNIQGYEADGDKWNDQKPNWNNLDHISVIDSCEGEILDYDSCSRQCRVISDQPSCVAYCEMSDSDRCAQKCSADIEIPWYCPLLPTLFTNARNNLNAMGLQPNDEEDYATSTSLRKRENATGITTDDTLHVENSNIRVVIFRPYGDRSGAILDREITNTRAIDSQSQEVTEW